MATRKTRSKTSSQKRDDSIGKIQTVPEMLEEAAAIYRERNVLYGDAYKIQGEIVQQLFPNGVHLIKPIDHNRYTIVMMLVSKIIRYANNFDIGGHDDSLLDISVYSNMLREIDKEK